MDIIGLIRKIPVFLLVKIRYRFLSRKRIEAFQIKKIRRICGYASRYSSFFDGYFESVPTKSLSFETYITLPYIEKKTMMEYFSDYNTKNLDREKLLDFAIYNDKARIDTEYYQDIYSVGLSSGTSGSRGLCIYSKKENEFNIARFLARNGMPGGLKKHHILFALRNNVPAFNEVNRFGYRLIYKNYDTPLEEIVKVINNNKLNIISGSPTFLTQLALHASKITSRIDVVISYAEVLEEHQKKIIKESFNTRVHQLYAGTEGYYAASCKYGKLHLNEDFLYFNLIPVSGRKEIYNMIVTDLYRKTQPIINYRLDDMIELDTTGCKCGSSFRIIKNIIGRADDYLVLYDSGGKEMIVYSDFVCRAIISSVDNISEYQVIQKSPYEIDVLVEFTGGGSHLIQLKKIKESLASLFKKYTTSQIRISIIEREIDFSITEKKKHVLRSFSTSTSESYD